MKDHTEYIKNQIGEFLEKETDMDATGSNQLTSEEHYTRRAVDAAFDWLREKNHEARDFRYGLYYRLIERLDDRDRFAIHYRFYFIVLAISAWWVGLRCGFRRVRRIRRDMWSVSLPGATWYIYDECRTLPCICVYPSQNRGAPNFEIGIFGKHFFRNLRLVDSVMPWLREEVKVQLFELEKKKKIHSIKAVSGIL